MKTPDKDTLRAWTRLVSMEAAMAALLLLGVSVIVFAILSAAPGDPLRDMYAGEGYAAVQAAPETVGGEYGGSSYQRYQSWLGSILHGDLGASLITGRSVSAELSSGILTSLALAAGATLVTLLLALPAAAHGVAHADTGRSVFIDVVAYIVSALPLFWLGYAIIYLFSHKLGIFPVYTSGESFAWPAMLLPILILGSGNGLVGEMIRHVREALAATLAEDYVRTARSKGVPLWRHVIKEGVLLPASEVISGRIPHLLGGLVIVEQVFNLPGLGRLVWQAALDRDYPVIIGVALAAAVLVRSVSFLHRVMVAWADPRVLEG